MKNIKINYKKNNNKGSYIDNNYKNKKRKIKGIQTESNKELITFLIM